MRKTALRALLSATIVAFIANFAQAGSAIWDLNPGSGDWNTAANWTPTNVPNGTADTATFSQSNTTGVSISADTEVDGVTFTAAAPSYTIVISPTHTFSVSGTGITNNSANTQRFVTDVDDFGNFGQVFFSNNAIAGGTFDNKDAVLGNPTGGSTQFFNSSSAGTASFSNDGGENFDSPEGGGPGGAGGSTQFFNTSTAGNATIFNGGGDAEPPGVGVPGGGFTTFRDSSNAGHATFFNQGTTDGPAEPGTTSFFDHASAANGTFTNDAGHLGETSSGALTQFFDNSTAGNGMFVNNGGSNNGAAGGTVFHNASTAANGTFINNGDFDGEGGGFTRLTDASSAGNANFVNNGSPGGLFSGETYINGMADAANGTFINNGGANGLAGGKTFFFDNSTGGTSRIEVFGNGAVDINFHSSPGVTVGSIEGDGNVFLGANNLTVGSNNLSTTLSGVIQDGSSRGFGGGTGGSLTKIGTGTLELTNANTYTGGTTVSGGTLLINNVSGSGTGTGAVHVTGGTLGGTGTIAGPVTVGTEIGGGALISPGVSPGTLTIQSSLTLNSDAIYRFELNSATALADEIVANGVTINGAEFSFTDLGDGELAPGTTFVVIDNTSSFAISGTFGNLLDHSDFTDNGNTYVVSYRGGTGNDLTLTVEPGTEPVPDQGSTFLLLTLSLLGVMTYRWRSTRKQTLRSCA